MAGSARRSSPFTAASASSNELALAGELEPLLEHHLVEVSSVTTPATLQTLLGKADSLQRVRQILVESPLPSQTKDTFRHNHGFQVVLSTLRSILHLFTAAESSEQTTEELLNLLSATFGVLSESLRDHHGNRRYFAKMAEGRGWNVLKEITQEIRDVLVLRNGPRNQRHEDRFLGILFAFSLGDETLEDLLLSLRKYLAKKDGQDTSETSGVGKDITKVDQHASRGVDSNLDQENSALLEAQSRLRETLGFRHYWRNPEFIPSLINILLTLEPDTRPCNPNTSAWATFHHLVKSSHYNLAAAHSTGILTDILKNLSGLLTVCSYTPLLWSLAEDLIGLGINTLDDAYFLYRKANTSPEFTRFILNALKTSQSPPHIQFDLSLQGYSSIELPNLGYTFPPSSPSGGYTLSLWIRIDSFDPSSHTTIFGAFDTSQTCFVLVYLEKDTRNLILQTSVTSSKPSVRFKSVTFEEGQWYHVCISHKRPRKLSSSRASLFVNGEFVEQVKSQYPSNPLTFSAGTEGHAATTPSKNKLDQIQAFIGTPQDLASRLGQGVVSSRWSLASAQLFSEIISDDLIVVYYQLGLRYSGNFQDCLGSFQTYKASAALNLRNETLHPGNVDKSDIVAAIRQKASALLPESRIILNISATAVFEDSDRYSLNCSQLIRYLSRAAAKNLRHLTRVGGNTVVLNGAVPAINKALTQPHGVAVLTGNPVAVVPQSLDDASWRIGGCVSVGLKLIEVAKGPEAIVRAVEILFESVKDSWRNSEAMERENGFGILASLLKAKTGPRQNLPHTELGGAADLSCSIEEREKLLLSLLSLILAFVGYDAATPENSIINNPLACRILLVDLDIWRQAPLPVQQLYYRQFVTFGTQCKNHTFNAKRLSRMRIVRKMLDSLKGGTFSPEAFSCFLSAFKSVVSCNMSAETLRSLALFITYALRKHRLPSGIPSRRKQSVLRNQQSSDSPSHRLSTSTSTSSLRSKQAGSKDDLTPAQLGTSVLHLYTGFLCGDDSTTNIEKFARTVTNKWLLYLLAEDDPQVVVLASKILARMLVIHGSSYVKKFTEKSGGFIILRYRLKRWWNVPTIWPICFAILFGHDIAKVDFERPFDLFSLLEIFLVDGKAKIQYPEILPVITAMLQNGLKAVVSNQQAPESPQQEQSNGHASLQKSLSRPKHVRSRSMSLQSELAFTNDKQTYEDRLREYASTLHTICRFLADIHTKSQDFRDFALSSNYVQELLFVLFPVVVGSDLLSPDSELNSRNSALNFGGTDVVIRPLSRAAIQTTPIVRTMIVEPPTSPTGQRAPTMRRGSSFVLVSSDQPQYSPSQARLISAIPPATETHIALNVSNSIVEELLELVIAVFSDQLFDRKEFPGFGLFMKVPPGFQEHQTYFETYVLRNALTQLCNTIQLDQHLLWEPKILANLSRLMTHLGEAVYEGWFLGGAESILNFAGTILEYLQRPDVAKIKSVRLCSQAILSIRTTVLRVVLLRLSELDDSSSEKDVISFMDRLSYWQTVLLSTEDSQADFLRLVCYLLYTKLISKYLAVRLAAARLWRIILVQKPEETSGILKQAMTTDQKHLSMGFRRLTELDDETFVYWIDDHRPELDAFFLGAMSHVWEEFVAEENQRTEQRAKVRIHRRREKLKLWQMEDLANEDTLRRHEVSADHWMANIYASEHTKYQRAIQDQQDDSNFIALSLAKMNQNLHRPCGLLEDATPIKWKLDQTEGRNRMRLRVLPDYSAQQSTYQPKRRDRGAGPKNNLKIDTQIESSSSLDGIAVTPLGDQSAVPSGVSDRSSQPTIPSRPDVSGEHEDDFELVEDPRDGMDGYEDKNRKVMRTLQRGDQVQHVDNVSRIVGLEACEGLLILGKDFLYLLDGFFQRSDGEIVNVWQAPPEERDPYLQMISGRRSGNHKQHLRNIEQGTRSWRWEDVISISKRRFLFRDVAIEAFFTDGRSYLLTTSSPELRNELYLRILAKAPHISNNAALARPEDSWRLEALKSPEDVPQTFGSKFTSVFNQGSWGPATKKWIKGEISNFHYLMLINTMAGRTFNDLTQYPVFPWVLADYTSEELDLDNPRSFRDLSKPMGCQTPSRQAEFRDRYQSFAEMGDQNSPPFHYGTHYSSAMIVTSYLIRLQPFVQSYLLLQGGSFDHPDRLFYSIEKTWTSASRDNMTDVRELTPEFFYLPEFLTNVNGYNFGSRQGTDEPVDTVALPPWAKGDPNIFITKHRQALESPYVSKHLHRWIDLIFGQKQQGEAAIEATNVFHYLSYHGAKDLDSIQDPVERLATIGIIHNFGQTPHQIFQRAHPPREEVHHRFKRLDSAAESLTRVPFSMLESHDRISSLIFSAKQERLLSSAPFRINIPPDCDQYMEWGYFDGSVRFYAADSGRLIGLFEHLHQGQLSCAISADSRNLITAGTDCTISVWAVISTPKSIDLQPKACLFGHRRPVTVLAISKSLSAFLSASTDGQVLFWDLNRLEYVRKLSLDGPVACAKINDTTGDVMLCQGRHIALYTLNGTLLLLQDICVEGDDSIVSCAFYEGTGNEWLERSILITGHKRGCVNIWNKTIRNGRFVLELLKRLDHVDQSSEQGLNFNSAITCILPMPQSIYTGDEDGRVYQWDCIQRHGHSSGR